MFIYMFVWIGIDVQEIEGAEDDLETVDGENDDDDLENTKRSSGRVNNSFCNKTVA